MVDNWSSIEQPACPMTRERQSSRGLDLLRRVGRRWQQALGFVIRPSCLLCGAEGQSTMDLCAVCTEILPRAPPFLPAPLAPGCVLRIAALHYAWPVDLLVQQLKFGGNWPVARALGQLLADARRAHPHPMPEVIMPVPLHPLRLAERGFNQAEHIARFTSQALGVPLAPPLLQRRRQTSAQSRLSAAARRDNLHEAFQVDEHSASMPREPWQHVALLDDVVTTGSTLAAATSALRRVGIRHIEWWSAAAATLDPDDPPLQAKM